MSWARLKGSDARRASVLREAAARTDCDVVLALADVHETWNCFEPERGRYRRRPSGDDDGWRGGRDSTDDYELDGLVDSTVTLDCWIDQSGDHAEPIVTTVSDAEVCATTPSTDLRAYASEYEGYMGNYGNTMDRWYRRGALVLWPRRLAFAVRAEASPRWALDELLKRLRAKDLVGAREMSATLAPFWDKVVTHEEGRRLLTKALGVARGLDEAALAAMLLKPFGVEMVTRNHASRLVALVDSYGEGWAGLLLDGWSGRRRPWAPGGRDRPAWITSLPSLCEALAAAGDAGRLTARLLVEDSWRWVKEAVDERRGLLPPSRRDEALGELGRPILGVLEATSVIAATDLRDDALGVLREESDDLLPGLMSALRAAGALPQPQRAAAGLDALARHCAGRLEARLARPPRAAGDWSIDVHGGCACELCDRFVGFLSDSARHTFEWPLAQAGRQHVHSRIDRAELPVSHRTRRTGRPFTLVLTKTEAVFERERQARSRDQSDLVWLSRFAGSTAPAPRKR